MFSHLLSIFLSAASPTSDVPKLEVVAALDQGPGNVAVTPDGRIILSMHQFYDPDIRVMELMEDGSLVPFPNEAWAGPRGADGQGLTAVLGLRSDRNGIVWMLDNGAGQDQARVVGWDTTTDTLHKVVDVPDSVSIETSFHNDLALDQQRPLAYIADIGGALVVLNLDTGEGKRLLQGHESTSADDIDFVVRGELLMSPEGEAVRTGMNPITISPDNVYVYFGAMTGDTIYRVPTAVLANPNADD
ncbi:MAG: L-dopachrome tautomerase-related protein, partial [Pseudomonadota bacterium]